MIFKLKVLALLALICNVSFVKSVDDSDESLEDSEPFLKPFDVNTANVQPEEVTFAVYKNSTGKSSKPIRRPIKFLISGSIDLENKHPWKETIRDTYLSKGVNAVILVNYNQRGDSYTHYAVNPQVVGKMISEYIINNNYAGDQVHLIGLGLGAHIAGFAGKHYQTTGRKLGRITGLNPPELRFDISKTDSRLDKDDAEFVDVIHTDVGYNGFSAPIGTADFYPSGGKSQPACSYKRGIFKAMVCNYLRAYVLFEESINRETLAFPSPTYINLLEEPVKKCSAVVFGEFCNETAKGKLYLLTNAFPPFLALINHKQFNPLTGNTYFQQSYILRV